MTKEIVFLDGARTAFGAYCGSLRDFTATDIGVVAAKGAMARAGVRPDEVDHIVFGNALQTSGDAIYCARHVGLRASVPKEIPAVTVNRLCGSGFQSIIQGAMEILLGEAEIVLAGGTESMSQAPHTIRGARWGIPLGQSQLGDYLWEALLDTYNKMPMAITAENLAKRYGITREQTDEYAYRSQMAAKAAMEAGRLKEEIVPVEMRGKKPPFEVDEHPRLTTTREGLAALRPFFAADGAITPGNASGICDGAAAILVAGREAADRRGKAPLGRLISWGVVGCDPDIMGIGPVPASQKALKKAGLSLDDMDLIEVNEAFGPQYLAVEKELGLDRAKTNVNGGAIALGHPLAASGTRLTLTLLYELRRRGGRYGLATACIGGGQGIALVVESLPAKK